jgi:hypothetical protein
VPVGLKDAVKVVLLPAGIVSGIESPDAPKPVPDADIFVIVRSDVPVLAKRMVCVSVLPTVTFPKLIEEGVTSAEGEPPPAGVVLPVTPTQAAVPSVQPMTSTSDKVRMNDARLLVSGNADAGSRLPPRVWTSLMTQTNCQTRWAFTATGLGYTSGTGACTCPRGQSIALLLGQLKPHCPVNRSVPAHSGCSPRFRRVQPTPTEALP